MHTESELLCVTSSIILKLLIFCVAGISGEALPEKQLCSEGVCVFSYLCGTIIEQGEGLIDVRLENTECPSDMVCCKPPNEAPAGEAHCEGICVPFNQCMLGDEKYNIDLRLDQKDCSENLVCCHSMLMEHKEDEHQDRCEGKCVPPVQCLNTTSDSAQYDLRSYDHTCPVDLVCCQEFSFETTINNGLQRDCQCVPFFDCLDDVINTASMINLRLSEDECPNDQICCKNPRPISSNNNQFHCKGMCVPINQCPNVLYSLIDLRSNADCAQDQICCAMNVQLPQVCDGTCVPFDQCLTPGHSEMIQSGSKNTCPPDLFCCPDSFPTIPDMNEESGTCQCVSPSQCADHGIGDIKDLDLRTAGCSFDQICCVNIRDQKNNEEKNHCRGSCVPEYQCRTKNTADRLDLRIGEECPKQTICCEATDLILAVNYTCEGTCVPSGECSTVMAKDSIDLRYGEACPKGLTCCKDSLKLPHAICEGTCVPISMCHDYTQHFDSCSKGKVCCRNVTFAAEYAPNLNVCRGTCVTLQQCNDYIIDNTDFQGNIRRQIFDNGCPESLVCCESFSKQPGPEVPWTQWITDTNNMIDQDSNRVNKSCLVNLNTDRYNDGQQEFSWVVTVWRKHETAQEEYRCVGTLIKSDTVLVPADCIYDLSHTQLFVRFRTSNGQTRENDEIVPAINKSVHPDYSSTAQDNNIGLLILPESSHRNKQFVCLFEYNEQIDGENCVLISWDGSTGHGSMTEPYKHRVTLQSADQCQPGFLCTTSNEWSRNCINFQGAPLMCQSSSSHWKQAGLVMKHNVRCDATGIPKSILEISTFYPWIKEQLSPSFVQKPRDRLPFNQYLPAS
ncbi:uncharacterized protein LOC129720230 [Wyeomyia smithii]|uniref:uncharacterized protein LOC129720230 n=1 Tax=Wyeomyia smithii TaxID=174621 RepID=UPI002467C112|nr:uncharacterized protein LOC129720230 [Wyeomyia smithii]